MAADNLKLKEGVSFYQDLDTGFPIIADRMDDTTIGDAHPVFLFFGASGDLNTNRQAHRVIDLYRHCKNELKFIVIDVDHPVNQSAVELIRKYYKGYTPTETVLDAKGNLVWSHVGEVDGKIIREKIARLQK